MFLDHKWLIIINIKYDENTRIQEIRLGFSIKISIEYRKFDFI